MQSKTLSTFIVLWAVYVQISCLMVSLIPRTSVPTGKEMLVCTSKVSVVEVHIRNNIGKLLFRSKRAPHQRNPWSGVEMYRGGCWNSVYSNGRDSGNLWIQRSSVQKQECSISAGDAPHWLKWYSPNVPQLFGYSPTFSRFSHCQSTIFCGSHRGY